MKFNLNSVAMLLGAAALAFAISCTKKEAEIQPQTESFPAVESTPAATDSVVTPDGITAPSGEKVVDPQTQTGQHSDCMPDDKECLKVKGSGEQVNEAQKK